jgi:hypothetical protein
LFVSELLPIFAVVNRKLNLNEQKMEIKRLLTLLLIYLNVSPINIQAKDPNLNRAIKRMLVSPYQNTKRYESDTLIYRDSIIDVTFDLLSEPYRRFSRMGKCKTGQ